MISRFFAMFFVSIAMLLYCVIWAILQVIDGIGDFLDGIIRWLRKQIAAGAKVISGK